MSGASFGYLRKVTKDGALTHSVSSYLITFSFSIYIGHIIWLQLNKFKSCNE
jgi:hypothetical protein